MIATHQNITMINGVTTLLVYSILHEITWCVRNPLVITKVTLLHRQLCHRILSDFYETTTLPRLGEYETHVQALLTSTLDF